MLGALRFLMLLTSIAGGVAAYAADNEVRLSLPVDYALVRQALVEQIFIGPNESARVLESKNACNVLTLSEPRVEGGAGKLHVMTKVISRGGTPLTQGRCLPLFEWTGVLEATEEPALIAGRRAIGFRVTDSNILNADGKRSTVPGVLWGWIKDNVHPRLEQLELDLSPPLSAADNLLRETAGVDAAKIDAVLSTVRITAAVASVEALNIEVGITAPPVPAGWAASQPEPALSVEELVQWREAWQAWDVFATWLIKQLADGTSPSLRPALGAVLLDARYDLLTALASDAGGDPVRELFRKSWQRLRPLLREVGVGLPAADALRLLSFISASDALDTLDRAAPQLGFRVDRDSLRRLARILLPSVADDTLTNYSNEVDPALRELLGFDRDFSAGEVTPDLLDLLIPRAYALVAVDPALGRKLQGWVPQQADLDTYLKQVEQLLTAVAAAELQRGKIKAPFVDVYKTLLPATAWQETCWRQFEIRRGRIETVQSSVGSVGIMQVNKHVWRGIYDLDALVSDAGYNARAGNEILVHYFVDYAIRRGEHEKTGNPDNLARASYAVYNGGPGHLTRYRKAESRPALRKIDEAFFQKFNAFRKRGRAAVKACYGR